MCLAPGRRIFKQAFVMVSMKNAVVIGGVLIVVLSLFAIVGILQAPAPAGEQPPRQPPRRRQSRRK
ncbi:hypothetical protein COU36_05295 [Candidatus Micrarchaeota archaeon CG10_big_fil_rev_8_21_14_0_10_59_7]|nr:MAG: hypothetical protein COU36_05295 [Candidatus Micrarchaeota archaeon CG10_big_fil_rev_8_21_14_0_10_59_7]